MTLKNSLKTIIGYIIFFLVLWLLEGDAKSAAIFSLFIAVTVIFIYNMIAIYLYLKDNRFNMKFVLNVINWKYYVISTIIIGLAYMFLLPEILIMIGGIITLCLLVGLFIFDIVRSIFKF